MHRILLHLTLPLFTAHALAWVIRLALVGAAARYGWTTAADGTSRVGRAVRFALVAAAAIVAMFSQTVEVSELLPPNDGQADFIVHTYGLLIDLGFLTAAFVTAWFIPKNWPQPEASRISQIWVELVLYIFVAGAAGAWLLFRIVNWREYVSDPVKFITAPAGMVYYGSAIGGWAVTIWFLRRRRIGFWRAADMGFIGSLGQAIGRLACFSAGCCWGKVVPPGFPLGATFPGTAGAQGPHPNDLMSVVFTSQRADHRWFVEATGEIVAEGTAGAVRISDWALAHGHSLPIHPVQLYEAAGQFLLFLAMWGVHRRRKFEGQVFSLWVMGYAVVRGSVEVVRGDLWRGTLHGLWSQVPAEAWYNVSTSQLISIAVFAIGAFSLWYRSRVAPSAPPAEPPADAGSLPVNSST